MQLCWAVLSCRIFSKGCSQLDSATPRKMLAKYPTVHKTCALESQVMDLKGRFSTSPAHFLTKKTTLDPESLRTEFQAAIYQDSVFEFHFIFLILLRMVFCILMV